MKKTNIIKTQIGNYTLASYIFICTYLLLSVLLLSRRPVGVSFLLSIIVGLLLFYILIKISTKCYVKIKSEHFFLCVIIYLPLFSILLQRFNGYNAVDSFGRNALDYSFLIWRNGVLWFLSGYVFSFINIKKNNFFSLVIVVFILLLFFLKTKGNFVIEYGFFSDGEKINHLSISDYLQILLFISFAFSASITRIVICCISLFLLFIAGGRSGFFFYTISLLVYYYREKKKNRLLFVVFFLLFLIVLGYIFYINFEQLAYRMLFTDGLDADGSFLERISQFSFGFPLLKEQFLFGAPHLLILRFKSIGGYMHNILSAWQFYGFPFFLAICITLVKLLKFWRRLPINMNFFLKDFFLLLFIYVFSSILFAKSILLLQLWFVLGLGLGLVIEKPQ